MSAAVLVKNQCITLDITGVGSEGNGVGRHQGMAVFVPLTAPGDKIRAKVVKVHSRYAYGILEEVLIPGPGRAENDCPVYRQCGGCSLRHLTYEQELEVKQGWVADHLRRIGGVELAVEPIIPSPRPKRYRNKAQYPIRLVEGRVRAGFFARRSHRLIPVEDCLLQPAFFGDIAAAVTGFMEEYGIAPYDEAAHTGTVRHLFIRCGEQTGQVMVWLSVNGEELPHWQVLADRLGQVCPGLASFGLDVNTRRTNVIFGGQLKLLAGQPVIRDVLAGVTMELSPLSFYQVNRDAAELLFRLAADWAAVDQGSLLLDLYCGAGAVGLAMASRFREVVGVEVVPQAVENARRNAEINGNANARFLCGDAGEAAVTLSGEGLRPDVIVLDPPRKGAGEQVLAQAAAFGSGRLLYISCDSATLARDCKTLAELGYALRRVRPVDLFPRTANVECCCLFETI